MLSGVQALCCVAVDLDMFVAVDFMNFIHIMLTSSHGVLSPPRISLLSTPWSRAPGCEQLA